jgi:hypothetical protein
MFQVSRNFVPNAYAMHVDYNKIRVLYVITNAVYCNGKLCYHFFHGCNWFGILWQRSGILLVLRLTADEASEHSIP